MIVSKFRKYIEFLRNISTKIPKQRLIILLSLVVGTLSGLAAVLLKNMVFAMTRLLVKSLDIHSVNIVYFAFPFFGLVLTVLFVRLVLKEKKLQGITRILYAISKKGSKLKIQDTYSSLIASTLTVGAGGSVGLESPIVLSGSAIGSNIGRFFRLNYKTTTLLLGCGAAGATAGIFSAPVAAVVFALEILMIDLTTWSIIPLLIAAVSGTAVSWLLLRDGAAFSFTVMDPLVIHNLPFYVLLGLITGIVSIYFVKGTKKIENWMDMLGKIDISYDRRRKRFVKKHISGKYTGIVRQLIVGGSILGIIIFLLPPLYGEGYEALNMILTGHSHELVNGSFFYGTQDNIYLLITFLFLVMIFKVIAMAITTGSGGVGGIFAPSLFMGGVSGYIVATIFNMVPFFSVSSKNFVVAGMAGVLAGVMHAPLTAIFLITETTSGHGIFLPITLTAAFSFVVSKLVEPNSIYTDRLAKRGELITHNKDKAVLTLLQTNDLIETDFTPIHSDQTLRELTHCFSESKRNIFPVINKSSELVGIIYIDNIRPKLFQSELYDSVSASDLMSPVSTCIELGTRMEKVMEVFEKTNSWNLPVVNKGKYVGFLSKSKIFSAYRIQLQDFYD
ncbi:chloride channel protein [Dysgonomonas macrotermitis]|uniref:Chloride channel protein, CIC family n=1 Tax=Dysgonomonas macrotermitis TaxID=1346286 RepID=A0A1M5DPT8_9BACT|nr:chloride channel protein [Dysgonomonas macrotermitis]SHF68925.1 chloride channel protein, CIC family [Dysgonomonas macrotermitis]